MSATMSGTTASFAFFEALWEAGVSHCFVNLGSDHPSIIEAMIKGARERPDRFPRMITCPNEMVAMSMADGFARLTSQPQAVIVHVDVGTQGLGAAVHNASTGRCPVLVFAGMSPFTCDGELRGSRTEYIHWVQDVPDQKQIVAQYCRYAGEIKTGQNIKQMVGRALQLARSAPAGPVYLCGAREVMEEEARRPYTLDPTHWAPVSPAALPPGAAREIAEALFAAEKPLLITGYAGRNHAVPAALIALADLVPGLEVLDTGGSDMCFPADHPAWLSLRFGIDDSISVADAILVLDCDVPWIPTQCKPPAKAKVFHVDADPLKQMMPVFYLDAAHRRYRADALVAVEQLVEFAQGDANCQALASDGKARQKNLARTAGFDGRIKAIMTAVGKVQDDGGFGTAYLCGKLRAACPDDTVWAIEAVTNTALVADALRVTKPGHWINCGGGGLGWSGGGALGIKLASNHMASKQGGSNTGKFVVQIVGDGSFLFSVPGSVYWITARYNIPVLTIILNNDGWNAPRRSLLLVHPDGAGAKASNKDINISLDPSPDYAGIAKAAAGGHIFTARLDKASRLEAVLKEAVAAVEAGTTAVLDCKVAMGY